MKNWYLVYCNVKNSRRDVLIRFLNSFEVEVFNPIMTYYKARKDRPGKFRKQTKSLFSNYMFIQFDCTKISFSKFDNIEGISYFLRSSGQIATIPEHLIENLRLSQAMLPKSVLSPCDANVSLGHAMLTHTNEEEKIRCLKLALESYQRQPSL